ncbi:class E sortase [Streptomyces sp. NPDC051921]|uniref:class E sortase n=1 Tax=Streptomyces sp. NPDC051921 TaxID=3155806 RepID=UPI00341B29FE
MTTGSPWFRAANLPEEEPEPRPQPRPIPAPGPVAPPYEAGTGVYEPIPAADAPQAHQASPTPQEAYEAPYEAYGTETYGTPETYGTAETYGTPETYGTGRAYGTPEAYGTGETYATPDTTTYATPDAYGTDAYETPARPEPRHEPQPEPRPEPQPEPRPERQAEARPEARPEPEPEPDDRTMALRTVEEATAAPPPGPGRAERRRAAKRKGRGAPEPAAPAQPAAPLSRVEARRAARAAKESLGVVLSRVVGELFITFGVVMLLFVTYQLWWTNVRAGQESDQAKKEIENSWSQGQDDAPGAFEPGKGFAIMYIPKLDVVVPIAEGISKPKVLDKGMVGHYGEGQLKTAMPADKQGNFAVAGHRNTHGEPFRYINRLQPGDPIVVETRDAYYTYEMASILPQTSPSNVSVIDPVPKGSGFTRPGRYITLTTCTPEFTSTYRMIVWGKLVDERPRSKGKPEALVG